MRTKLIFVGAALIMALAPIFAFAGSTVIIDTVTYPTALSASTNSVPGSLPGPGVYVFDLVVDSTNSVGAFGSVGVYLQQEGLSRGAWYTIVNSTFTSCTTSPCAQFIYPDVYLGGRIRALWTITNSSASVKVTARQVSP